MSASSPLAGGPAGSPSAHMASAASPPEPQPGCRVQILKDRATVRYIGTVRGQEGTWVGVEWDDPSRGKHDGTTGGVRYFTCESGHPTAGSFVRMEKVEFGHSVLEALIARYTNKRGEMGDVDVSEMYVQTVRNRRVQIELVGEEMIQAQQKQIQHLPSARIVGAAVSHLGDPGQLTSSLPSLTELDLTCNLIHSWDVAEGLSTALPQLKVLNLSDNRLALPASISGRPTLPGLRALVLNDCGVTWGQVLTLEPLLPALQELHLCGNNIRSLHAPGHAPTAPSTDAQQPQQPQQDGLLLQQARGASWFRSLQVLSLEDNEISDWSSLLVLAWLPHLSKLHLSNNPVPGIHYPTTNLTASTPSAPPPTAATTATAGSSSSAAAAAAVGAEAASSSAAAGEGQGSVLFAALRSLLLGGCQLSSWAVVDQLGRFPALKELRLTGNPVLSLSKSGGRFEVIGRVPGLESLNGAAVLARERRDAETRYLQNILAEMEEAPDADAKALVPQCHPRYKELLDTYGNVLGTVGRAQAGTSIASSLVQLSLTCVAASKNAKMGTQVKKLPRSVTVGALRLLCEKLFKVQGSTMTLFLRMPGDPMPEDIGGDEDKTLVALGVQDGYEVLVDEFDPEARRKAEGRQREADQQAQAAREDEQGRAADLVALELAKAMAF